MKLWLDDMRTPPEGYTHSAKSVIIAKILILLAEETGEEIELIDCDHDLGEYSKYGGDGIKLLDWLLERGTLYPIKIHTLNPVGKANMQRLLDRYWRRDNNMENWLGKVVYLDGELYKVTKSYEERNDELKCCETIIEAENLETGEIKVFGDQHHEWLDAKGYIKLLEERVDQNE